MATILDRSVIEQALKGADGDTIIARPGEPIVNISAVDARRKASGYIGREISSMMGGTEPGLVYSDNRLVWRVPIIFTSPSRGQLGIVGVLDVDAHTGDLLIPADLEKTIQTNAHAILENSPHPPER